LRGSAVVVFGLALTGGPGLITTGIMAFSVVFMLPIVLTGTILLGVVDTGLDLRRRWSTPQERT
jgi:Sec-independent protein secretion pathway component TatC